LTQAPLVSLADVNAPRSLVLRPTLETLRRDAGFGLRFRLALARARGRLGRFEERVVERRYKPVHWLVQDGAAVGYSEADLGRLARLGRRWLELAGVRASDVVVSVAPAGPHLEFWELALGGRAAGVPTLLLDPSADAAAVASYAPTVLAGRPMDALRLLEAGVRPRAVLALGEPLDAGLRSRLAAAAGGAAVLAAWAPAGVRSLWVECVGQDGFHTAPEAELLEVVDPLSGELSPPGADGELVWTALGWRGTVLVRMRTGVYGSVSERPCRHCGAPGPIVHAAPGVPAFLGVLDRHLGVRSWLAELSAPGGVEELVVFLNLADGADVGDVCHSLDEHLSATQYVVLPPDEVDARVRANGDRRVIDLR
jgi:hypothetical protein